MKKIYIDKDQLIDDLIPIFNRLSPKDKGDIMETIYKQKQKEMPIENRSVYDLSDVQIKAIETALHHQYFKTVDDNGRAITCTQEMADTTYGLLKIFEGMRKEIENKEDEMQEDLDFIR